MIWKLVIYASLAIFVLASIYRIFRIAKMPMHLRWELAPVPGEKGKDGYGGSYLEEYEWWKKEHSKSILPQLVYMAKEVFLLRGVWEHRRGLWLYTFLFHNALYFMAASFLLVAACACAEALFPAFNGEVVFSAAQWILYASYAAGTAGSLGLLAKRMWDTTLRTYTTFGAFFNLALVAAVLATGAVAIFSSPGFVADLRGLMEALVVPGEQVVISGAFAAHVTSIAVLLAYLPFSFMIHFVAKYFTYHDIRWDDAPLDTRKEDKLAGQLGQPVTWSAPHVGSGEGKTWIDLVNTEKSDGKTA